MAEVYILDFKFDLMGLQTDTAKIDQLFVPKLRFMKNWQGVPLRNGLGSSYVDGLELSKSMKDGKLLECFDSDYMQQLDHISIMIKNLETYLNTKIGMVRLLKIPAGDNVPIHKDGDCFNIDSGDVFRLHIPIFSIPDVCFVVNSKKFYLMPGRLYCVDVSYPHTVINSSSQARVHLVIDVVATDELRNKIKKSDKLIPN